MDEVMKGMLLWWRSFYRVVLWRRRALWLGKHLSTHRGAVFCGVGERECLFVEMTMLCKLVGAQFIA